MYLPFCGVYRPFLSSHLVIGDVGSACGLQASRLLKSIWTLEAVKQVGDNPPAVLVQVITWPIYTSFLMIYENRTNCELSVFPLAEWENV